MDIILYYVHDRFEVCGACVHLCNFFKGVSSERLDAEWLH